MTDDAPQGKLISHLGCPVCSTSLFELRAVAATNPGVSQHVTVPLVDDAGDGKVCPICGDPLSRVAAP